LIGGVCDKVVELVAVSLRLKYVVQAEVVTNLVDAFVSGVV